MKESLSYTTVRPDLRVMLPCADLPHPGPAGWFGLLRLPGRT